jgi:hypothetical protein
VLAELHQQQVLWELQVEGLGVGARSQCGVEAVCRGGPWQGG